MNPFSQEFIAPLIIFSGIVIALLLCYMVFAAIFETVDHMRVVRAAERWAKNKERRNQRNEAKELWDSVNALRRNHGDVVFKEINGEKIPAYRRKQKS